VSLVVGYVRGAVLERLGEADQSLLFWYLPLLLFGIPCTLAGLAIVPAAVRRLRDDRRIRPPGGEA